MITVRRSEERGFVDHGWLKAHHTFAFGDYHDPAWTRFGTLRVLNQDVIAPGQGFGEHGHRDMEIVTWVLDGALQHRDSMGNGSVIRPGDAQRMSAGTGVLHSEFNASDTEPAHLLQMWVFPDRRGDAPGYEQRHVPEERRRGRLALLASPDGADGSLTLGADARLLTARLDTGDAVRHELTGARAWLHVARGRVRLQAADGETVELGPGDGAGLTDTRSLGIEGLAGDGTAELVLFDLP